MMYIKLNIQRFASGTIDLGTSGYLQGRITWSSSSNGSASNSSNVTGNLQVRRTNNYTTTGTWSYYFAVGATNVNTTWYGSVSNSWVTIRTLSNVVVGHNADGKGSCYIHGKVNGPSGTGLAGETVEAGKTVTLDTIPRKTAIGNFSGIIGKSMRISFSPASSSFTHTLTYSFGNSGTITLLNKSSAKYIDFVPPKSLYQQLGGAQSGTGPLTLQTYSGNTLIGTSSGAITLSCDAVDCKPVLNAPSTLKDVNETTIALTGDNNKIIANRSTGEVVFSGKIKNYANFKSLTINGVSVTPTITSNEDGSKDINAIVQINNLSSNQLKVILTDNRNYSITEEVTSTGDLIPYIPLTITADFIRVTMTGGHVRVKCDGKYFDDTFGYVENNLELSWGVRLKGEPTYTDGGILTPAIENNTYTLETEITNPLQEDGLFNYQDNYEFIIYFKDKLTDDSVKDDIRKGIPIFSIFENSLVVNNEVVFYV